MKKQKLLLIGLLVVSGCATQNNVQYEWVKGVSSKQETEYIIADSSCLAESYKAIPELSPGSNCDKLDGGISKGYCRTSESRNLRKRLETRAKIYDGCMLGKGWKKRPLQ